MSRALGYSLGLVVFLVGFRRGWKLAQVRTQLQDLEARLRSVDWSYAKLLHARAEESPPR